MILLVLCLLLLCIVTVLLSWCGYHYSVPLTLCDDQCGLPVPCDVSVGIPKKIWTFWNTDHIPSVIQRCVDSWKRCCPEYTITILTPTTLHLAVRNVRELLELPYADTPQRLADFVRLHVLYEHGGFWVDASSILFSSLDVLIARQQREKTEYVGYYIQSFTTCAAFPVIENWFFGCVPKSTFVGRWKNEFLRINQYCTAAAYVDHIRMHGFDISGIPYRLSYYLSMHVAAQVVLQRKPSSRTLCSLDVAEHGPLAYLASNGWKPRRAVQSLASDPRHGGVLFVKLRGSERRVLASDPALLDALLPVK